MRALALLAILATPFLAGCAQPTEDGPGPSPGLTPVTSFVDIHGLAVDPSNPAILYVATHRGLIRSMDANATTWARIGANRDDFMGFTIHPANSSVFWSSGHPETTGARGPNLGVRISTDGGFTWRDVGLPGVDLHAMGASPAKPDRLWGWASAGQLRRSDDAGASWALLSGPRVVSAFAGDPDLPNRVLAATPDGVQRSEDAGGSWGILASGRTLGIAIDRRDPSVVWRVGDAGVQRSQDGGATFVDAAQPSVAGPFSHVAIDPSAARSVYVATYSGAIARSDDQGATWRTVRMAG